MTRLQKSEEHSSAGANVAISKSRRIPSLDGLRALSISMVVIAHAQHTISIGNGTATLLSMLGAGHTGVSFFFVISGFLISGLLLNDEKKNSSVNLSSFYFRRSFRIIPPLYFYVATIAVLGLLGKVAVTRWDCISAVLFATNYLGNGSWFLGHTWSLSIEEQFYLIWPFVFLLNSRSARVRIAVAIIALSPIIRVMNYVLIPSLRARITVMGHTRADMLMIGCLLALFEGDARLERILLFLDRWRAQVAASLFLFVADPLLEQRFRGAYLLVTGYTLEGGCIAIILMWTVRHPSTGAAKLLNLKPIMFVGKISFSLYLWQQLFLTPENTTATGRFPLNILSTFVAAVLSFFLIERTALRLRDRFSIRSTSRTHSLATAQ